MTSTLPDPRGIRMSDDDSDRFEALLLALLEAKGLAALLDLRVEALGSEVPEDVLLGTGLLRRELERIQQGLATLWRPAP